MRWKWGKPELREKELMGAGLEDMARPPRTLALLLPGTFRSLLVSPPAWPPLTPKRWVCLEKPLHPHSPFLEIAVVG